MNKITIDRIKSHPDVKALLATSDLQHSAQRVYLNELIAMYEHRAAIDALFEPSLVVTLCYIDIINSAKSGDMISTPPDSGILEALYASALRLAVHRLESENIELKGVLALKSVTK